MFQGDLNQGSFHERSFFIVFSFISLFHSFFFDSLFFLAPFFFNNLFLFLLISIFQWGELNISWNSNFSYLPSSIKRLVTYSPLESNPFLPPNVGVIFGRVKERNLSGSKRRLLIICILVMGWWKMAIFHFKHSYLNWRVIPCKRKMICVYAIFSSFSQFSISLRSFSTFCFVLAHFYFPMRWAQHLLEL